MVLPLRPAITGGFKVKSMRPSELSNLDQKTQDFGKHHLYFPKYCQYTTTDLQIPKTR